METTINYFKMSDGETMPYEVCGSGETVIFVHGLFGKGADFKEVVKVASKSVRCITYDHRGHGNSKANSGFSLAQFAKDLKGFIEYLKVKEVILVGYSMGAFTIFSYVEQFGCEHIKKIVLLNVTPKMINDKTWSMGLYGGEYFEAQLEKDLVDIKNNFMGFASYFTYRNMTKHNAEKPYQTKATILSSILARLLIKNNEQKRNMTFLLWKNIAQYDFRETLQKFTVPVGIFYADPGSLFSPAVAKYMKENIKNCEKLVGFTNASHAVLFSHGEQFCKELLIFIKNPTLQM